MSENELNPDSPAPQCASASQVALPAPNLPELSKKGMEKALRQLNLSKTQLKNAEALRVLGGECAKTGIFQYALGELIHSNVQREELIRNCLKKAKQQNISVEDFGIVAHSLNAALNGKNKCTSQMLDLVNKPDWQDPKPDRPYGAPPKRSPIVLINAEGNVAVSDGGK